MLQTAIKMVKKTIKNDPNILFLKICVEEYSPLHGWDDGPGLGPGMQLSSEARNKLVIFVVCTLHQVQEMLH